MAKARKSLLSTMAAQGRRRPNLQARVQNTSRNTSAVKYNTIGVTVSQPSGWNATPFMRFYVGGLKTYDSDTFAAGFGPSTGRDIVSSYSTCKFLPGTSLSWSPSVGFTTSGRVFIGFTDNPEVAALIYNQYVADYATGDFTAYSGYVKSLGDVVSHHVFEEFTLAIPTRLRRKMFDVNSTITLSGGTEILDRSGQVFMFGIVEGGTGAATWGSVHYHDNVAVEGIRAANLT